MQNTEDKPQSPTRGKRRTQEHPAGHMRAKTLKQVQDQAKDKGNGQTQDAQRRSTQVGQGQALSQDRRPAKTLRQQSFGLPAEGAATPTLQEDRKNVQGPPSIPAEAKLESARKAQPTMKAPESKIASPDASSPRSDASNLGFGKTMMMSGPIPPPAIDNPPQKTEATTQKAPEQQQAKSAEAQVAKTLMMNSPIQPQKTEATTQKAPEQQQAKSAEAQVAKTLMMNSPIQPQKTETAADKTPAENLAGHVEAKNRHNEAPSKKKQATDAFAIEDTIPPEKPATPQLKPTLRGKIATKMAVADPESTLSPSSESYDTGPESQAPKNIWAIATVAFGFLLALSLAANGYLWFALNKVEDEKTGSIVKTSNNPPSEVQQAAALSSPGNSASPPSKPETVPNQKKTPSTAVESKPKVETEQAAETPKAKEGKTAPVGLQGSTPDVGSSKKLPSIPQGLGKLVVRANGRNIRVSVNRIFKGHAPLELELEPGKYDLNFSQKGNRSFKRVVVEAGETLEVTAKVDNQ